MAQQKSDVSIPGNEVSLRVQDQRSSDFYQLNIAHNSTHGHEHGHVDDEQQSDRDDVTPQNLVDHKGI